MWKNRWISCVRVIYCYKNSWDDTRVEDACITKTAWLLHFKFRIRNDWWNDFFAVVVSKGLRNRTSAVACSFLHSWVNPGEVGKPGQRWIMNIKHSFRSMSWWQQRSLAWACTNHLESKYPCILLLKVDWIYLAEQRSLLTNYHQRSKVILCGKH